MDVQFCWGIGTTINILCSCVVDFSTSFYFRIAIVKVLEKQLFTSSKLYDGI